MNKTRRLKRIISSDRLEDVSMEKYYENKRFEELSNELMKPSGKSDTIGGELIRAVNRICYRFFNDGDVIGCGYGNETCNAAGRYVLKYGNTEMKDVLNVIWNGEVNDSCESMANKPYELLLSQLVDETVKYLDSKSEELNNETSDMLDFSSDCDSEYDLEDESIYW